MNDNIKKESKGKYAFSIMAIIVPLLYFLMYLPVWGEKGLVNGNMLTTLLLAFEVIAFLIAVINLLLIRKRKRKTAFSVVFILTSLLSFSIFCFVAYFFTLELSGIEWFPAQK